jgi:hypothetical protein
VLSGCKQPRDCDWFIRTYYRGHWFWIDDRDFESKRTMAYLMVLLALADTGTQEPVPFLTIHANWPYFGWQTHLLLHDRVHAGALPGVGSSNHYFGEQF